MWSSLIGGVLSAATVLVGVFHAQRLSDDRKHADEQRADADALLLEIANARDAAVHSRSKERTGRYDLWPLRHQTYLSHSLRGLPVLHAVQRHYDAVWDSATGFDMVRLPRVTRPPGDQGDEQAFADYQRAIEVWADHLIDALREPSKPLSDLAADGPDRPVLPS
jgi:hypothetical protein